MNTANLSGVVPVLVVVVLFSGCLSDFLPYYDSVGPVRVRFQEWEVHDARNLTLRISVHNTGDTNVSTWDGSRVIDVDLYRAKPDGTYRPYDYSEFSNFKVTGLPGKEEDTRLPAFFNRSDVLGPGESRNFSVHIQLYYDDPPDLVGAHLTFDYTNPIYYYDITYYPPCVDLSGEVTYNGTHYCNRFKATRGGTVG